MIFKIFTAFVLVTLIYQTYALQCYKYECRGETCDEFRKSTDKNKFAGECSSKSTGCRHVRAKASSRYSDVPPPPIMEKRDCWEPGMNGIQAEEDECSGGGWNEHWSQAGKRLDVDLEGDTCLCFSNLCNGKDLPSSSTKNLGSYWLAGISIGMFLFASRLL